MDALESLYTETDAFTHILLVSGDGDFTDLVHRLRAHGKVVIGMGISGTSAEYLVNACDKFIYYDKWQGVGKIKKPQQQNNPPQNQNPPAPKQNGNQSAPKQIHMATTPEGRFEQYSNLLAAKKIRVSDSTQRPLVIYKIYEMAGNDSEQITFNQLKEQLEAFFADSTPKIEAQVALDVAHQLFYTFCFEFDPESHERILNRKISFANDVQKASDLLDKCDRKLLQLLVNDLGSSDKLDKEVAARILYGGVRNPKILDHITDLINTA